MPFTHHSAIGIDLDGRLLSAAQLVRVRGGWCLSSSAVVERLRPGGLPDGDELDRAIDAFRRQGLVGSRVVLSIPNHLLLTGTMEMPPANSGAPIARLVRNELAGLHKCDPERLECAHWVLPETARSKGGSRVIATGVQRDDAESIVSAFESRGLRVTALDVGSWSAIRALGCTEPDDTAVSTLVGMHWSGALIVLVHHGVVVSERWLPEFGLERLDRSIAALGLGDRALQRVLRREVGPDGAANPPIRRHLEGIGTEVLRSLTYLHQLYPEAEVTEIRMLGDGAVLGGAESILADATGIPCGVAAARVEPIDEHARVDDGAHRLIAIGLAAYEDRAA